MFNLILILGYAFAIVIVRFISNLVIRILKLFVLSRFRKNEDFVRKYGRWAIVTGSTDGIGKAYVRELAKRGMNIVLISRTLEKLENTAQQIHAEFAVSTKIIVADFTHGPSIYQRIKHELRDLDIGILVNNVATSVLHPMYFDEYSPTNIRDAMFTNIGSTLHLSNIVLARMKERRKGAIINISSISDEFPLPFMSIYSATKACLRYLTLAWQNEYKSHGITVQLLSPGFVKTKFNDYSQFLNRQSRIFMPTPQIYADYAIRTLGLTGHTTGYWLHDLQYQFGKLLPMKIKLRFVGRISRIIKREYDRITTE